MKNEDDKLKKLERQLSMLLNANEELVKENQTLKHHVRTLQNHPDLRCALAACIKRQLDTNCVLREIIEYRDKLHPQRLATLLKLLERSVRIVTGAAKNRRKPIKKMLAESQGAFKSRFRTTFADE